MTAQHKFTFAKAENRSRQSIQVVHVEEQDQLVFCHHEVNDYFQAKYFPAGKYSRPTQHGVNNGYYFRPSTIQSSQLVYQ